jgi:Beta-carotene isomerase D27-like, C-terminal
MNAWATKLAGTWLMGECELNDVLVDGKKNGSEATTMMAMGRKQGLLVKRCRFLEESGCASICVNSCKIPTQNFFLQDMGLPLTMEPNYETFECQFSFGRTPDAETELDAKNTPCLARCPAVGSLRKLHDNNNNNGVPAVVVEPKGTAVVRLPCPQMGTE